MISSSFLHSLSPSHTSCLLRSTRVWLNEVREWSVCKGRERHGTSDGGWWWSLGVGGNDVGERDHHLHSLHTLRSGHEWHGNEGPERGVVGIQVGREPACLSVTFTHIHSPPYPTPLPLHTRVTTERRHVTRVMGSEGVEVVRRIPRMRRVCVCHTLSFTVHQHHTHTLALDRGGCKKMGQLTIKILLFLPTGGEPACGVVGSVDSGILFVNHVRTHHTIHTSLIPFPPCDTTHTRLDRSCHSHCRSTHDRERMGMGAR